MARPAEGDQVFENSRKNVEYLKALAVWIFHRAARNLPEPPDENRADQPAGDQPAPGALGGGWSLLRRRDQPAQALEMLPGIEEMDLEKRGAVVAA